MPDEFYKNLDIREIMNKDGFYITCQIQVGATATKFDHFFIANSPCEVVSVSEAHRGASGGVTTLNVEKLASGQAIGAGVEILSTTFDLNGTANTPVFRTRKSGIVSSSARQLARGDRLALKVAGDLTFSEGIIVTVYLIPLGKGHYA